METATRINDTIVCEIDIDAPPERVFQAWIDPQQRLAWWGDAATYRCTSMDSDLRVGGKWRTQGTGMEGRDFTVQGHYTRIEPPRCAGLHLEPRLERHADARDACADRADANVVGDACHRDTFRIHRCGRA